MEGKGMFWEMSRGVLGWIGSRYIVYRYELSKNK